MRRNGYLVRCNPKIGAIQNVTDIQSVTASPQGDGTGTAGHSPAGPGPRKPDRMRIRQTWKGNPL